MKQLSKLVNKSSALKVLSCKHEPMKGFLSVNKESWEYRDNEPKPFYIVKSDRWHIELPNPNDTFYQEHGRKLFINGQIVSYDCITEMKDRFLGMRSLREESLYQSNPNMYYAERWK